MSTTTAAAPPLVEQALRYARAGLPVFPLSGKLPRTPNGFRDASTDPGQLRDWWRRWPEAGVGLPTGGALRSGGCLAVLDIDPRNDGDDTLETLETEHGALPDTFTVRTGGGGWHFYYSTPDPLPCRGGLYEGIDLKASGGYVVAPPSLHPDGPRYRVERRAPVAPMPDWLVNALRPARRCPAPLPRLDTPLHGSRYVQAAIEFECDELARTPKGRRNEALNRSAYALARFVAAGTADAAAVVRALAYAATAAGLPERETIRTIKSAFAARERAA